MMKSLLVLAISFMLGLFVAAHGADAPSATNNVAKITEKPVRLRSNESTKQSQCEAITKSGNRCKRKAAKGERFCRQHLKIHTVKAGGDSSASG